MTHDRHLKRTGLFLLRVWTEDAGDGSGKAEWHGKVQRVVNGESRYFHNWPELVELLAAMAPGEAIRLKEEGRRMKEEG
jgi:hypothetical protein